MSVIFPVLLGFERSKFESTRALTISNSWVELPQEFIHVKSGVVMRTIGSHVTFYVLQNGHCKEEAKTSLTNAGIICVALGT